MGARGPAPTPTAILETRGSRRAKRRRAEPRPERVAPACPAWLSANAKIAWRQIVPQLECMGVLTRVDANALARYCTLWARWRAAETFIDDNGDVYPLRDEKGAVKCLQQFPQVAIAHKLALQLAKLEAEFGMTPASRSRIQVATPAEETVDPMEAYLREAQQAVAAPAAAAAGPQQRYDA